MDMQLYMVACQIKWSDGEQWKHVVLHPGMMHTLMSFIGCISTLMKCSRMETVLSSSFGPLTSIHNDKAWLQALRAYRMITAALLHDYLRDGPKSYEEIGAYVETSRQHPTGKLWVDCLIKPTLIALHFVRAKHEGDILLRECCIAEMLPYCFASGHHHYARYITMYLR